MHHVLDELYGYLISTKFTSAPPRDFPPPKNPKLEVEEEPPFLPSIVIRLREKYRKEKRPSAVGGAEGAEIITKFVLRKRNQVDLIVMFVRPHLMGHLSLSEQV